MPRLIDSVRAAGFDLDGTLIDTAPDLTTAVNAMLSMLGAPVLPEMRIRALIGGGVDQLVLRALKESLKGREPHEAQRSAALSLFGRLYGQRLFEHSRIYPDVTSALGALADAGIRLCCITNKASTYALPLLSAARLNQFFAFTLSPGCADDRKPSPNLLLAACSRFGVSPAEMLYVGDSRMDIVAARSAGCRAVAVNYGYNYGRSLEEIRPDGIIGSLTELIGLHVRPLFARTQPCLTGAGT
jgi:phosphoglycolate phosphatase